MTRITIFLLVAIGGILIARPGVEVRNELVPSSGDSPRPRSTSSDPRDDEGLADDIEDAILDEYNRARRNPQAYALQIEALRSAVRRKLYSLSG